MPCVEKKPRERCIKMDDGVKIFARIQGRGTPIVLVHGWGMNETMWDYQVPVLKKNHKVVAIDLRGFGQSERSEGGYTYEQWADDLDTVIERLKLRHVTLAGYSIGGAIAMHYMAEPRPDVEKLVLIAAGGPYMRADLDPPWCFCLTHSRAFYDSLIPLITFAKRLAFEPFIRFALPAAQGVTAAGGRSGVDWLEDMWDSASPEALVGGLEQLRNRDLTPEVHKIRTPTRICHGFVDPFVPYGLGMEQQRLIPGSELYPFWDCGHGLFFEDAGMLNRKLDW